MDPCTWEIHISGMSVKLPVGETQLELSHISLNHEAFTKSTILYGNGMVYTNRHMKNMLINKPSYSYSTMK